MANPSVPFVSPQSGTVAYPTNTSVTFTQLTTNQIIFNTQNSILPRTSFTFGFFVPAFSFLQIRLFRNYVKNGVLDKNLDIIIQKINNNYVLYCFNESGEQINIGNINAGDSLFVNYTWSALRNNYTWLRNGIQIFTTTINSTYNYSYGFGFNTLVNPTTITITNLFFAPLSTSGPTGSNGTAGPQGPTGPTGINFTGPTGTIAFATSRGVTGSTAFYYDPSNELLYVPSEKVGSISLNVQSSKPPLSNVLWSDGQNLYYNNGILNTGTGTNSGTDSRLDLYFLNPPPPISSLSPINGSPTSSEVYLVWTNPTQIMVGFTNQVLPHINQIIIQHRFPSGSGPWITSYADSFNPVVRHLIINQGIGQSQNNQTRVLNGVFYNNMILIYIGTKQNFDIQVYFTNFKGDSNMTSITNLGFLSAGPPSIPSISITPSTSTTATLEITPGQFNDVSNNTIYSESGAPTLTTYDISYTPINSSRRFGGVFNTTRQLSSINALQPPSNTILILNNLFPDSSYNIQVRASNSVGLTSLYRDFVAFQTVPQLPNNVWITNITTAPVSAYSLPAYLATSTTAATRIQPVYCSTQNTSTIISPLFSLIPQSLRGSTSDPICTIRSWIINSSSPTILNYPGFPASRAGTVIQSGEVQFSSPNLTIDQGSGASSGFYLSGRFTYNIKSGLSPQTTPYSLQFQQIFNGDSLTFNSSIPFYIDGLPLNTSPSFIRNPTFTDNSTKILVTGVPLIDNNWSLTIQNVEVSNSIFLFSPTPVLTYSYLGTDPLELLKFFPGTGLVNSTLINSAGKTITGTTSGFYVNPSLTINVFNLNNRSASISIVNSVIIDPVSISLITTQLGSVYGLLMNSPNVFNNMLDWSTARTSLNHNQSIVGTNNLQILNGYFVTPTSTIIPGNPGVSYGNYSAFSGPNYTSIGSIGYRWASFKWTANQGIANSLIFTLLGFQGVDTPTINNSSAIYLNNIRVFYRLEDPNYGGGDPVNQVNPGVLSPPSYSTVWIDALTVGSNFSTNYALNSVSTTIGGLINGISDLQVSGSTIVIGGNSVYTPLQSGTLLNIYLIVGLPLNKDIAFVGAHCNFS